MTVRRCVLLRAAWLSFAAAGTLVASPGHTGPYAQQLGKCINDSFDEDDRAGFVRWIFATMAAHPTVEPMTKVTEAEVDTVSRSIAASITRVLAGPCAGSMRDMVTYEGATAFQEAFALVGQFSAASLMTHPKVIERAAGFARYMEQNAPKLPQVSPSQPQGPAAQPEQPATDKAIRP